MHAGHEVFEPSPVMSELVNEVFLEQVALKASGAKFLQRCAVDRNRRVTKRCLMSQHASSIHHHHQGLCRAPLLLSPVPNTPSKGLI